jgi:hypothetical protein
VKSQVVDYEEMALFAEVDLDDNPCIVLSCGHVLTMTSMDGHMDMSQHYEMAHTHQVVSLRGKSEPFTLESRVCPSCRMPLRHIQRYNRILRRVLLDDATKKFIAWSMATFVPLSEALDKIESKLVENPKHGLDELQTAEEQQNGNVNVIQKLALTGDRDSIIKAIVEIPGAKKRYGDVYRHRRRIERFLARVQEEEQPFGQIYQMIKSIKSRHRVEVNFVQHPSVLQTRQRLLAKSLSLRCDAFILGDFFACRSRSGGFLAKYDWRGVELDTNFEAAREECLQNHQAGLEQTQPAIAVEGLVFWARFVALERLNVPAHARDESSPLRDQASKYLIQSRDLCEEFPAQTRGLLAEVESAEKSLQGEIFYNTVTAEERRQVIAAMASEFNVSGHWYHCPNGHPFTIGECGRAMERSNCPECGAMIGGAGHLLEAGNTRAERIEREFADLQI